MLFKMFAVFEIYEVPYYLTYDLDFDMIRLKLSRSTVPLLTLITNY